MAPAAYDFAPRRTPWAWLVRARSAMVMGAVSGLVTACSAPVSVSAPDLSNECRAVLADAPIRVLGELQRATVPREASARAWGDPPIVLVCGVEVSVVPGAQVFEVNGVAWSAESSDVGTVFTSVDSEPAVQVRVPVAYRPEADVLLEMDWVEGP